MEDVWIDLCSEVDVARMDYCWLTLWQLIDLKLIPILEGVEDDNKILDKNFIIVNWRSSFLF